MSAKREPLSRGWRIVASCADAMMLAAGVALAVMIAATGLDICCRALGIALTGSYDLVRLSGAVALSCALPGTTASKGHVAIEFFHHKLKRSGRIIVDTLVHSGVTSIFALATWQCVKAGNTFLRTGEVTPTLQVPLFWVPWVMAAGCLLSALVSVYHITHPGREMIKP